MKVPLSLVQYFLGSVLCIYVMLIYYHSKSTSLRSKISRESSQDSLQGRTSGDQHRLRRSSAVDVNRNLSSMGKSVLYCISTMDLGRIDVMEELLDNAVDWCEGGYSVSVIIDTFDSTVDLRALQTQLMERHLCSRTKLSIDILLHEKIVDSVRANVAIYHRHHFRRRLYEFDIFVYGEDDMSIRLSSLNKWVQETAKLGSLSLSYYIGFVRYENARLLLRNKSERVKITTVDPNFKWQVDSPGQPDKSIPQSRITWEMDPESMYITDRNNLPGLYSTVGGPAIPEHYYLAFNGTLHYRIPPFSAMGIYTREQLQDLDHVCLFLSEHKAEIPFHPRNITISEFYSSSQPFQCGNKELYFGSGDFNLASQEFQCCKQWLLPVNGFESLFVHHIGTPGQKADTKWAVPAHLRSGSPYLYQWRDIVDKKLKLKRSLIT
jgi:hypothetical protein